MVTFFVFVLVFPCVSCVSVFVLFKHSLAWMGSSVDGWKQGSKDGRVWLGLAGGNHWFFVVWVVGSLVL